MADETLQPPVTIKPEVDQSRYYERANNLTGMVLQEAFPDKRFTVFSNNGSGSVIWSAIGDIDTIYKVGFGLDSLPVNLSDSGWDKWYKSYHSNSLEAAYAEAEARKVYFLNQNGLGPKLVAFIPAKHRTLRERLIGRFSQGGRINFSNPGLEQLNIPILNKNSRVPVIIKGKVDFREDGLDAVPLDTKKQWASQTVKLLDAVKLYPADVEIVFDEKNKRIVFLDPGGLSPDYDGLLDHKGPIFERLMFLMTAGDRSAS